jgi:predicted anti-sigma-YlaC factor YlaD
MGLNNDQIRNLLHLLTITREHELNCNEFLERMGEFAERDIAGLPIDDILRSVEHHLVMCAECREEYEALIAALKRMKENKPPSEEQ